MADKSPPQALHTGRAGGDGVRSPNSADSREIHAPLPPHPWYFGSAARPSLAGTAPLKPVGFC